MQRLGTLNLAGIVDNVFRLVRKLSSDALQRECGKVRSLFVAKSLARVHLCTGGDWQQQYANEDRSFHKVSLQDDPISIAVRRSADVYVRAGGRTRDGRAKRQVRNSVLLQKVQ